MEPEQATPCSHEQATGPYAELDEQFKHPYSILKNSF
jgi:hypothetical protein